MGFKPEYRSYFGKQVNSKKESFPEWGFGTSKSEALIPLQPSRLPGPGSYAVKVPQPCRNSPHKAFLAWGKLASPPDAITPAHLAVPSPTKYTTCTAHMIGKTFHSASLQNSPRFSWSRTSTREARAHMYVSRGHEREGFGSHSPGPHAVGRESFSSMGRQSSSCKPSNPRFAAPRGARFMVPKACDTSHTPGPGSYNI